jgi:cell wall-associated NlpC family hydrolase
MKHLDMSLALAFSVALSGCIADAEDPATDAQGDGEAEVEGLAPLAAGSNPAVFDLHCLWAGESYASRAPNQYAAQAIRNACNIQAALIPYKAPGMYPLTMNAPTAAQGIDCSGLTSNVYFRATGGWVRLNHSAANQEATLPDVPWGQQRPGDLIFYVSTAAASGRHVAMYLGDGLMIEALGSSYGVVVSPVRTAKFSSIGRVIP